VKTRTLRVRFLRFWERVLGVKKGLEKINNRKNRKNRRNLRHWEVGSGMGGDGMAVVSPEPDEVGRPKIENGKEKIGEDNSGVEVQ
jgi:hypothetical protein